jgi:hypothetical protein
LRAIGGLTLRAAECRLDADLERAGAVAAAARGRALAPAAPGAFTVDRARVGVAQYTLHSTVDCIALKAAGYRRLRDDERAGGGSTAAFCGAGTELGPGPFAINRAWVGAAFVRLDVAIGSHTIRATVSGCN